MVQQIEQRHLDFVKKAKEAFENDLSLYTFRNGTNDDNDTLIALRYGIDRDCVLVYELGECVANFVQQTRPVPNPRSEVMKFAFEMEKQLSANEHKGGWKRDNHQDLTGFLLLNLEKLRHELIKIPPNRDKQEITKRCANIANFAMMVTDNEGNNNES